MATTNINEPTNNATEPSVQRMSRNPILGLGRIDSAPDAHADYRGTIAFIPGASGTADQVLIGMKDASDASFWGFLSNSSMYVPISLAATTLSNLADNVEASGTLIGGTTSASMADLTDFTQVKFMAWVTAAGTGTLRAAYDNSDGNGWRALGDAISLASNSPSQLIVSDWADIAVAARAPCIFAARAYAGNGTDDPAVRALGIMVR
jgi:hypothetical protein